MKRRNIFIAVLLVVFLSSIFYFMFDNGNKKVIINGKEVSIPKGNTHWHPKLTILIDGKKISIPDDIGYGTGRTIDTHLSGMRMSPTHTHESDGTIHIENNNPAEKPKTLTLGYFFYVWDKTFSATCVFNYCVDNGELKMFVNGEENNEFGDYIMHDGDNILIKYTTNGG